MVRFVLAALAFGLAAGAAQAAETSERWRGTVEASTKETLTIRRREGGTATMRLHPKTRVLTATPGRLRDIKPESYVSVITVPGPDGVQKPARVTIYSATERGFQPGTRPWDIAPGATFTAGWIRELSIDTPRRIELVYEGGSKVFTIPPDTLTAQISGGERAMLVPGAEVMVVVRPDPEGVADADLITVSRMGTVPSP